MKIPTPEKQKQTSAMVEQACAQMDKVNQLIDQLMEFLEQEDKLPTILAARKLRKN